LLFSSIEVLLRIVLCLLQSQLAYASGILDLKLNLGRK